MKQQKNGGSEYPWSPSSYGETEPYSPEKPNKERELVFEPAPVRIEEQPAAPQKHGSRLPYVIVSLLTVVFAVLQLLLPFAEWVAFRYQVLGQEIAGGKLNLIELGKKFLFSDNIVTFLTGLGESLDVSDYLLPSIKEKYAQGRAAGILVMAVLALSLLLLLTFAVMALTRRRGAAAVGIMAAVLNSAGCAAVFYAMGLINSILEQYDAFSWKNMQFSLGNAPTLSIALSAAVFVFSVIMAILRHRAYRR